MAAKKQAVGPTKTIKKGKPTTLVVAEHGDLGLMRMGDSVVTRRGLVGDLDEQKWLTIAKVATNFQPLLR
jgi:hypothetical protein